MSTKNQELVFKLKGQLDPSYSKSITAASRKMQELTKNAKGTSDGFSAAERAGIDFGDHSATAISNLDAALASAGIVAIISETAQAFMECGRRRHLLFRYHVKGRSC